jgi:CCR4-NOT transcription complex subunit 9
MSKIEIKDCYIQSEKENNNNNEDQKEEELIIKYTDEIKNEETRLKAIENLYKYREKIKNIGIYLWYTRGTMAVLLQELIANYQYLSPSKFNNINVEKTKHIISLFQIIALNPETRKEFIESQLLVFLYPFLKCSNKTKSYEVICVTILGVIAALVKIDDPDAINFLVKTGIIPVILRLMEKGTDLIMALSCFIFQRIIVDINGFKYICDLRERLDAIVYVLDTMLKNNNISVRIIRNILKIYLGLIENKEAKNLLKTQLPEKIRDIEFFNSLDDSSRAKVIILLKSLDEDDSGNDIKIKKLKNDLTNKNNSIQNINVIRNSNINCNNFNNYPININNVEYNNNYQMNVNNVNNIEYNNNNLNLMLLNNINQMQQGFMMSPTNSDFNYNIYNDNENYMNHNIYNQNLNNGYGNMNFFNTFNNI